MTISLRFAARSDVGLVRQSNQDAGYAGPHLCVLCDGMGGPAGGDIASAVAVEHLMPLDADSHQAGELLGLMRDAVHAAHAELVSLSAQDPDLAGLGTTCIGVMRSGNKLAMIHVGDSRAYMLRDGTLTQVTTDHTFVEYLVETGRLTRDQARQHPQRSVLLRVLGDAEGDVQLDESIREAVPGDRWLLCSDGLSGPVSAETIGEVLASVTDPGQAADQLIDLALRAGGPDNVTAVVFDVVRNEPDPQSDPQVVGSAATERLAQERAAAAARSSNRTGATASDVREQTGRNDELDHADSSQELSRSGPSTPAAKAAALMATLETDNGTTGGAAVDHEDGDAEEVWDAVAAEADAQRAARRHSRRRTFVGSLVLLAAVLGAGFLFYRWTQAHYYVSTLDDQVAIYRGIPQSVGPLELSHVVETYSEPAVEDLDERMRDLLDDTVYRDSLASARRYVEVTVSSHARTSPETEATSSATPTAPGSTTPSATSRPPSPSSSPTPTQES
ncbi:serine/threonine-protein phosphatase [Actinomyces lilanjuaniae]|uniref:Serine/threonine-protein phosphatase n=1 Tax=Actinomyces lilanjuaniae TaxID=2321394 RepID=A0ABN5PKW6_9ACTO|nr:protein phosphatase 2C domain-containing protein [Actinomyces lilanjuaniae]AYD88859.1 serine/threonine-protein phosphatase [Actinomyces lilanjuaniae]